MTLSDNIKKYRKKMNITQQQLAEFMDVTVGAVSKWESGMSNPDIMLLPKLAKLFGVSIDELFSFRLIDSSADDLAEKIKNFRYEKQYDKGSEMALDAIRRYPNHFGVIYQSATLFLMQGIERKNNEALEKALELFQRSCPLIGQNRDERVSELSIQIAIGEVLMFLNRNEEAFDHLKKYNYCGISNGIIGSLLSHGERPEEALPYLSECLLDTVAQLMRCSVGFANIFHKQNDNKASIDVLKMMVDLTEHLKIDDRVSYVDKLQVILLSGMAQIHAYLSEFDKAGQCLKKAYGLAMKFDTSPDYNAQNIKFYKGKKQIFSDDAGETAMQCVEKMVVESESDNLMQIWNNIKSEKA
mgnify:CR=1 FL=1